MPAGTVEGIIRDHGGVIYDGKLRSSEQASKQTAILKRYRGLSSLVLNKIANCLPFSCAETKFQVTTPSRHTKAACFFNFTSIEETGFPSNEQFIDNRSH